MGLNENPTILTHSLKKLQKKLIALNITETNYNLA